MTGSQLERTASALSAWEAPLLIWLASRMPRRVTPDGLTAVGFVGAALCAGGYALAARSAWGLLLASVGLVVNWFGDSLDGTLARYRRIERPRYGYFLDNGLDMLEQLLIAAGVAASGYVRSDLCFLALSTLFMMSSLSVLRARVSSIHQMAYAGIGLTELRLVGLVINLVLYVFPPTVVPRLWSMTYANLLSLFWSLSTIVNFSVSLAIQARQLASEDLSNRPLEAAEISEPAGSPPL